MIPESQKRLYLDLDKAKKALKWAILNSDAKARQQAQKKIDRITDKIEASNFKRQFYGR